MCTYCTVITDDDLKNLKEEPLNKAARFAPRHVEKSIATGAAGNVTGDLEWLCRHRPDQMCINCAPLQKGDKVELEMLCQHGPTGRCTNCLPTDTTVTDRKYITYAEWDGARRAKCEHGPSAMCPNCTPPAAVSYKLKSNCSKHRPWPAGLCNDCAPPLADLKAQPYRHVDYVQFNNRPELEGFINLWSANERAGVQRAAWLYGYTAPDANYPSGTKIVVEALYEPPQVWDPPTGAIKILPDQRQAHADAVAAAMGLRRVGWMFTKKPMTDVTAPTVAPRELQAMSALQNAFPNQHKLPNGTTAPGSQFVTVVIRKTKDGIEPLAYMATDQMQALVRDSVTCDATTADQKMRVKQQQQGEAPVPEVILSSQLRGRQRGVTVRTSPLFSR
jgi:nuclear protein localization family protein 4